MARETASGAAEFDDETDDEIAGGGDAEADEDEAGTRTAFGAGVDAGAEICAGKVALDVGECCAETVDGAGDGVTDDGDGAGFFSDEGADDESGNASGVGAASGKSTA